MKQLLSLFLFLLPCLAWAQYPSNGNQKITLGEQTSADGLIFRGVLADTGIITPLSDTSAYIILDTVNHRFYNYNRATNVWSMAGVGSISSGLTGVLPVANGGTNTSTAFTAGSVVFAGSGGTYTQANEDIRFITADKRLVLGPNTIVSTTPFSGVRFKSMGKIQIARSDQDTRFISIDNEDGVAKMDFGSPSAGYGSFKFTQSNNADTRTILHITGLGNVGINQDVAANITEKLTVSGNARITGNIAAGVTSATARLHLAAGTATASTAPLKFTSQGASLLNPVEAGAVEFNGTNLLFTPSTARHTVNHGLPGSATLNFPSTTTLLSADLTITVTGAADGDVVSLGVPNAAVNANTSYSAWVSAANTVTVRFNNYSSGTVDPASALFKVFVTK
jgi:hypothetical protein